MDIKRLENIRDFIINEIDCEKMNHNKEYSNKELDITYCINDRMFAVRVENLDNYNEETFRSIFNFENLLIHMKENEYVVFGFKIDMNNIRLLNRKRKLWMLKD